jgi:TPR repeat protein
MHLLRAAKQDHTEAQFQAAWRYETGIGFATADAGEAKQWYLKASAKGHIGAKHAYGVSALTWPKPPEDGVQLQYPPVLSATFTLSHFNAIRTAAQKGFRDAEFTLARLYAEKGFKARVKDKEVRADYLPDDWTDERLDEEAVRLFKKLADQGYKPAVRQLGRMVSLGRGGLAEDKAKARALYGQSGSAPGQGFVGYFW